MGTGTQKYGNFTEVRYTHVSKKLQTEVLPINFTEETTLRMNGCFRTVSFSPHRQARHHLVLTASYHSGKGIWRDQKMMTDTEHGNLVYYETLSKYKIQDDRRMTAGLEYRFERLKDDKQDFFVDALGRIHIICLQSPVVHRKSQTNIYLTNPTTVCRQVPEHQIRRFGLVCPWRLPYTVEPHLRQWKHQNGR